MKILYIYGYLEGTETDVATMLNEELKDKNGSSFEGHDVIVVKYPQEDFHKSVEFLSDYVRREKIEVVIGSYLGAFIALHLPKEVRVIALQPCMEPCNDIPQLGPRPGQTKEEMEAMLSTYQEANDSVWKLPKRDNVFACFLEHDPVLKTNYKKKFIRIIGDYFNLLCPKGIDRKAGRTVLRAINTGIRDELLALAQKVGFTFDELPGPKAYDPDLWAHYTSTPDRITKRQLNIIEDEMDKIYEKYGEWIHIGMRNPPKHERTKYYKMATI